MMGVRTYDGAAVCAVSCTCAAFSGNPRLTKKFLLAWLRSSFMLYIFSTCGKPVAITVTSTSSLILLSIQAPKMIFAE